MPDMSRTTRAEVRNAADPAQVRRAGRKDQEREERFLVALAAVLDTPAGRIVAWELLVRAGVFRSVWDPSSRIHYNAGRQDFGHEWQALLLQASEAAYEVMEREARAYQAREARSTDASHLARTTNGEPT